jgi:intracellular sulfur oxidation DsrE/DsrF family protein
MLTIVCTSAVFAQSEYPGLKDVESVKVLFDFRDGDPESALVHLKLVHETYRDKDLRNVDEKPEFVVVFMDKSVTFLSHPTEKMTGKTKEVAEQIAKLIPVLAEDGIKLEICMFAVRFFKGDPKLIPKEVLQVTNGWVSAIGYESRGYALVPAF